MDTAYRRLSNLDTEYSAYKFRESVSDSDYLIEDTVLETGTRAVWPDNNGHYTLGNQILL